MSIGHLYVFFEKCLFRSFAHFKIGFVLGGGLSVVSTLYILDINPLSDVLMNMFSHSLGCLLILLMVSFAVQKSF